MRVRLRAHEVDRLLQDFLHDVDARAGGEPELAALDPRKVEVLAHEAEEVLALALHALHLGALFGREVAQIALGEDLGVGDHRGDRALELVAHEPEHLRVGVVGLLELLDAPGLLDGLAEALGDRHLQLDVLRAVGVRLRELRKMKPTTRPSTISGQVRLERTPSWISRWEERLRGWSFT